MVSLSHDGVSPHFLFFGFSSLGSLTVTDYACANLAFGCSFNEAFAKSWVN